MQKGEAMNVRKSVDYSTMYWELTTILAQNLPQMDEIYAIGKAISPARGEGRGGRSCRVFTGEFSRPHRLFPAQRAPDARFL